MGKITQEEVEGLKARYGTVYQLDCEDGRVLLVADPLADFSKAKLLFTALASSIQEFSEAVVRNCAVGGDMELADDSAFATGVSEELKDMMEMPTYEIKRNSDGTATISSCGASVTVRSITRNDLVMAPKKDKTKGPFEENLQLLGLIAKSTDWRNLEETNSRGLIGILSSLDELKSKLAVTVKKL